MSRDKIWHLFSRKLTNEASTEELHELQQLQEDNPTLIHEMDAIEQLWNSNAQEDTDYLEATYHLHVEKMKKLGIEPMPMKPADMDDLVKRETAANLELVKAAGIKP